MSAWIRVEDRLPDDFSIYLIAHSGRQGRATFSAFDPSRKKWSWEYNSGFGNPVVTHWMTLPELPTEAKDASPSPALSHSSEIPGSAAGVGREKA